MCPIPLQTLNLMNRVHLKIIDENASIEAGYSKDDNILLRMEDYNYPDFNALEVEMTIDETEELIAFLQKLIKEKQG